MKQIFASVTLNSLVEIFCFQSEFEAIQCMEDLQEKDPDLRYVIYTNLNPNMEEVDQAESA